MRHKFERMTISERNRIRNELERRKRNNRATQDD